MTPGVVGGPFLSDLTHDLRTPLNGILGFAALLHEGKLGPLSPDQQECLDDILASARDMARMLAEVSDLGRVESGQREIQPEPVNVRALVDEVCGGLRELAEPRRVRVVGEVDPTVAGVVADRSSLKQIASVCGALAVKATPDGGRVVLRVVPEDAARFRLEIEDGGSRIQDIDPNVGLGFVLSRRLAEIQGGTLRVRAAATRGSVVAAVLPRTVGVRRGG
jgi:two-component system NtrC family sensor kinase